MQARVEVKNPDGLLRPGMLARAEIESADAKPEPTLVVPDDAVVTLEDEHVVFLPVEGDSGKFKKQEVQVGQTVGGWTQVESGLKEGEKIVVRGATIIRAQFNKPPEE